MCLELKNALKYVLKAHIKIYIILIKKNFQRYAIAHSVAFYVYIVEVGSLLLWKFGLGSYSSFCGLLALRAAASGSKTN